MAVEIGWGYPSKVEKPKKVKKEEPKKEEAKPQKEK